MFHTYIGYLHSTGFATRFCNGNGEWLTVDASGCISRVFQEITDRVCLTIRMIWFVTSYKAYTDSLSVRCIGIIIKVYFSHSNMKLLYTRVWVIFLHYKYFLYEETIESVFSV